MREVPVIVRNYLTYGSHQLSDKHIYPWHND